MKLRIHYMNKKGDMAYQDAEFEQPKDGPSADMSRGDYEDGIARSFGQVGFKGQEDDTGRIFWISPHWVIEVEKLPPDTGLVLKP